MCQLCKFISPKFRAALICSLPVAGLALLLFQCNRHAACQTIPTPHDAVDSLGRYLFFSQKLSATGTHACSHCHDPKFAFSDGYRLSTGIYADHTTRNSPSLINVSQMPTFNWANPELRTLEDQMLRPLFSDKPVELGLLSQAHTRAKVSHGAEDREGLPFDAVLTRLRHEPEYIRLAGRAYPYIRPDDLRQEHLIRAIADYIRTLISYNSPYDAYLRGQKNVLSADAQAGMNLFFSRRTGCGECHNGINLSDGRYHNIGLYHYDALSDPETDMGVFSFSKKTDDKGRFRTPSLRNVAVTAPYFHDGSVPDLAQVIRIFERGGHLSVSGNLKGDGARSVLKSKKIRPFTLTDTERRQLILFLESLTDSTALHNPWFYPPNL